MNCLISVVNSNIFMANGAFDQGGESSPNECRSCLLQRGVALPEAVRHLSREFDLSERQAYRYLEEGAQLDRPVEIPEATVSVTLKLPPRTVELLRNYARSSGLTIGAIVTAALTAFLRTLKRHG
jgi:hypothetical protein